MQCVEKIRATIESLLFITNEPLTPAQLAELAELEEEDVLDVLSWLQEDYSDASKGIGVIQLGEIILLLEGQFAQPAQFQQRHKYCDNLPFPIAAPE